jgi:two-component system, LuxR family, response regulator FixJ
VKTSIKTGIIAIVDDDQPLREALGSVMKAAGYSPKTFATAEDFLECEDCDEVACLILDVRLTRMSGIELQRKLAKDRGALPIIFITAHGDSALRDSLLRAGASAFFYKPVRSDALLKEIYRALDKTHDDTQK